MAGEHRNAGIGVPFAPLVSVCDQARYAGAHYEWGRLPLVGGHLNKTTRLADGRWWIGECASAHSAKLQCEDFWGGGTGKCPVQTPPRTRRLSGVTPKRGHWGLAFSWVAAVIEFVCLAFGGHKLVDPRALLQNGSARQRKILAPCISSPKHATAIQKLPPYAWRSTPVFASPCTARYPLAAPK